MSENPVMRIASVTVSIVGLLFLIAQGALASIIVGKGIVAIIAAALGFSLVNRLPDSVHEYFRRGEYLPRGHTNRYDVVYPPGSSKRKTRNLSIYGVLSGSILVAGGFFLGPVDALFALSSGLMFALTLIVSRPGAIERMLIVSWTVPQVWLILFFSGFFWTFIGPLAAALSVVLIHSLMEIVTALPVSRAMIKAAEEANIPADRA